MNWYEEWFNADEYLQVYKHRDEKEANQLLDLLFKNINSNGVLNVLDMACGAGRHAISFAKRGFNVTAVDLSERLLKEAKRNAEESEVKINFVHSDIREFQSKNKFQLAVNLFTSFGYFETDVENFEVFNIAYRNLDDSGYFVLDYLNENYLRHNLNPITVEKINGKTITQNRSLENGRVIKRVKIESGIKYKKYYESVKLYSHSEINYMLETIGFGALKIFGDFYGNPFNIDSSPRVIFITQR